MSIEAWLESSVLLFAFILLALAGIVDASLNRRQRLTIREMLEEGPSGRSSEPGVEHAGDLRSAADCASLIAVLLVGGASVHLGLRLFEIPGLIGVLVIAAVAVLFIGRALPEIVVERYGLAESEIVHVIGQAIATLMAPAMLLQKVLAPVTGRRNGRGILHGEAAMMGRPLNDQSTGDESSERSDLQQDEQEMISGVLGMDDAFAREIMVPRPDIIAVALDTPLEDVARIAQEAGHSRIPVYEQSIDQVRGVIYAKDLLRFVTEDVGSVELESLLRPAMYVPESKRVDDLLRDLRKARVHLAIVVDEYGGTAGLVTIEDIIEEIVGEIQDEYDRERPLYQFESDRLVTVDGRMSVDELAELIDVTMPETESDTVGGLVQRALGHIPEPGETVEAGPVTLKVVSVERRRVETVQVMLGEMTMPESVNRARAN